MCISESESIAKFGLNPCRMRRAKIKVKVVPCKCLNFNNEVIEFINKELEQHSRVCFSEHDADLWFKQLAPKLKHILVRAKRIFKLRTIPTHIELIEI